MDLRSIINTESGSNQAASQSSLASKDAPGQERSSFAAPPAGPTPYAPPPSRESYPVYNQQQQQQQHQSHHPSIDALTSPYTPHSTSNPPFPAQVQQQPPPPAPQRSQSIHSVLSSDPPAPSYSPVLASHSASSQQFSPGAQRSLPGTPLGPPPASFARNSPSSSSLRPQSSGYDSQANQPSSPWARQESYGHEQRSLVSPGAQSRHAWQETRSVEQQTPRQRSTVSEKEREDSVSPRTVATPGTRHGSSVGPQDQPPAPYARYQSQSEERTWKESPTQVVSHPPPPPKPVSRGSLDPPKSESTPTDDRSYQFPSKMDVTPDAPPKRKRRRYNEPPIYAQRCSRTRGKGPIIQNPIPPIPKHARNSPANPWVARMRSSSAAPSAAAAAAPAAAPAAAAAAPNHATAPAAATAATTQTPTPTKSQADGADLPTNGPSANPPAVSEPTARGLLGPWEPSITGYIPHEDLTKTVCDFLFQHVVLRNDVGAGPAGSSAAGQGAIIEIEAKMGRHIDLDRGDRLVLPIMTESVLNKENSRIRTSFESSMSSAQHRAMNNFLNEAVKASLPQTNPGRIPLSYAHKKERDTFYEISPSELPPVIRQNLNPRHKPRVRVTTDQRTGEVLAKIVKCRVADLDIVSPRTWVDFRISVNLEISYDGEVGHLPIIEMGGGKARDRNKDRMSYRHLAYQVDLTQVATSDPSKNEFDHELEIEISAAEIRRQGQLAMSGDPGNQYEDLVKGFVDNIRVLARAVPQ